MGVLTGTEVISHGLTLAGNTNLTAIAAVELRIWLKKLQDSADWRFFTTRYGPFALAAGTSSFEFGDGTKTPDRIDFIRRVVLADSLNTGFRSEVDIVDDDAIGNGEDPLLVDSTNTGLPGRLLVTPATSGSYTGRWRWLVQLPVSTDRATRVIITARQSAASSFSSASTPWYPNDKTMTQVVFVMALRHQNDERVTVEENRLKGMEMEDLVRYAKKHGQNKIQLSRSVFRRRGSKSLDPLSWLKDRGS